MTRKLPHLRFRRPMRRAADQMKQLLQPPTVEPPKPETPADDEETKSALKVLNLAMAIAELQLAAGDSVSEVTATTRKVARSFGMRGVHTDVTFNSINLAWHRPGREPLSTLRVVRGRTTDYTRLQHLGNLVREIEAGELDVGEAQKKFYAIAWSRHPYRDWVVTVCKGLTAVGLCMLWGARPIVMLLAFLSCCAIRVVTNWLFRKGVPAFFRQAAGASIPTAATLVTAGAQSAGNPLFQNVQPGLIVSAGIVVLLAGMSVVGAAQDSIDGYYVTASARTFEVVMLTLGIIAGILVMVRLGKSFGSGFVLVPAEPVMGPIHMQILGAMLISAAFAIGNYASPKVAVLTAALGVMAWVMFLVSQRFGFGDIGASTIAALLPSIVATAFAVRMRVPALALTTGAIVALMPGSMTYRGLLLVTEALAPSDTLSGLIGLMTAAGVGLGLAAGTSLGAYLTRPLTRRQWRRGRTRPS